MNKRPGSSRLLQLIDALDRSVAPQHHTRIISDALHAAGIIDLPQDRAAFRDFVSGPLCAAITQYAGEAQADEVAFALRRQTSYRAPSSRAPRSNAPSSPPSSQRPALETAGYVGDLFADRCDVMLIDAADTLHDALRIHLEARELILRHERMFRELDRDVPPRAIVVHAGLEVALDWARRTRDHLEDRTPPIVVVTTDAPPEEVPTYVQAVLAPEPLAPLVTSLEGVLAPDAD